MQGGAHSSRCPLRLCPSPACVPYGSAPALPVTLMALPQPCRWPHEHSSSLPYHPGVDHTGLAVLSGSSAWSSHLFSPCPHISLAPAEFLLSLQEWICVFHTPARAVHAFNNKFLKIKSMESFALFGSVRRSKQYRQCEIQHFNTDVVHCFT